MRNLKTVCVCICIAASTSLIGCSSSEQLKKPSYSKNTKHKPGFIDSVSIQGNATTLKTDVNGSSRFVKKQPSYNIVSNEIQAKYADMLGVLPQYVKSLSLYGFIEDWYGVRYRFGGNDKDGIDCSAFVQRLYDSVFGINLLRTAYEQFSNVKFVDGKHDLQEGDLVFFRKGKHIGHVGVYLMNNYFVHASSSGGVMISSLNESYWQRRYAGAGYIASKAKTKYNAGL